MLNISYLTYKEIDKEKWDECILNSINSLLYAHSFYLDAMAGKWNAIILGDYEAVMPLTYRKKWGVRYIYQPPFIQQLGIFSPAKLSQEQIKSFLELAFKKFSFAEFTLNFDNKIDWNDKKLQTIERNNYILNLNRPYDELYENYDPAFTKSLRRIQKFEMLYASSVNFHKTIELYKYLYGSRLPFFSGNTYTRFELVCKKLFKENNVVIRHARSKDNELLCSVILLKDENRLYNLISCITTKGKKAEANYFLYDSIIREFANMPLLLDFEGSDVEGIANFYQKFTPENQSYPFIKYNNLPVLIKLFKK